LAVRILELTAGCHGCLAGKKTPCEFEVAGQEFWKFEGAQYKGCPFKQVTGLSANFIRAYNFYKSGFLPNGGSWLEQPAKFIEAVEVIENELAQMRQEQMRKYRNAYK